MTDNPDNVVRFPGVTLLDIDPDVILKEAMGTLDKVLILGYTKEDDEFFASSFADGPTAVWMMERFKLQLLNIVDEDDDEDF